MSFGPSSDETPFASSNLIKPQIYTALAAILSSFIGGGIQQKQFEEASTFNQNLLDSLQSDYGEFGRLLNEYLTTNSAAGLKATAGLAGGAWDQGMNNLDTILFGVAPKAAPLGLDVGELIKALTPVDPHTGTAAAKQPMSNPTSQPGVNQEAERVFGDTPFNLKEWLSPAEQAYVEKNLKRGGRYYGMNDAQLSAALYRQYGDHVPKPVMDKTTQRAKVKHDQTDMTLVGMFSGKKYKNTTPEQVAAAEFEFMGLEYDPEQSLEANVKNVLPKEWTQTADEAEAERQARYAGLPTALKGYAGRYEEGMGLLQNLGDAAKSELATNYDTLENASYQDLVSSGLAGTTVAPTMRQGVAKQEQQALDTLNEQLRREKLSWQSALSGDFLAALTGGVTQAGADKLNMGLRTLDEYRSDWTSRVPIAMNYMDRLGQLRLMNLKQGPAPVNWGDYLTQGLYGVSNIFGSLQGQQQLQSAQSAASSASNLGFLAPAMSAGGEVGGLAIADLFFGL